MAKQNQAKRQQMESMGFAIAYDNIDLNDDDLDEMADEIEEIEN